MLGPSNFDKLAGNEKWNEPADFIKGNQTLNASFRGHSIALIPCTLAAAKQLSSQLPTPNPPPTPHPPLDTPLPLPRTSHPPPGLFSSRKPGGLAFVRGALHRRGAAELGAVAEVSLGPGAKASASCEEGDQSRRRGSALLLGLAQSQPTGVPQALVFGSICQGAILLSFCLSHRHFSRFSTDGPDLIKHLLLLLLLLFFHVLLF